MANHGPTNMANHEPTIMANQSNQKFGAKCNQENRIRIDILDMAFISTNLAKHDIQFQIGDDLGSNHLPIEISIDTPPPPT